MDKNTPIQRRCSLNSSQVSHPIAESTCLNGSISTPPNACWFGQLSPRISFRQRSNSNTSLSNVRSSPTTTSTATTSNKNSSNLSYTGQSGHRLNLSRIDPRIYADVNSSGLVSRVVKYQESHSKRLQSSMSVNNLYNKPGQFPVVHLTKKEIPFKASKNNVSMTRIAPPERTVFYGDTLSGLLRSNSIVGIGTHKTDEQLSCENRPIIHPPPTESDLEPTRSVLDVLKEISRKRINTNDVQQLEQTKKSCSRNEFCDLVDTAQTNTLATYVNINSPHSYKRQREIAQLSQPDTVYVSPSGTLQHTQTSPEQMAKRRQNNYNNDITSSLSSSLRYTKKRKLNEQPPRIGATRNSTTSGSSSSNSSPEGEQQQVAKIQRKHTDLQYDQTVKSPSCSNTPITPLPVTPSSENSSGQQINVNHSFSEKPVVQSSNAAFPTVPSKRTVSAPVSTYASHHVAVASVKPKLTLFNKNYECNEQEETHDSPSPDILEASECAGISFVKPKKPEEIIMTKNPIIERTQKSKLALMLRGLRGEIYRGMPLDEIDSEVSKSPEKLQFDSPQTVLFSKPIADTTIASSSVTKTVAIPSTTTPDKPNLVSVQTSQLPVTIAPSLATSILNNGTAVTGTPSEIAPISVSVTTAAPIASATTLTFAAQATSSPATAATPTFTFGVPKALDSSTSNTANNTASHQATTITGAAETSTNSLMQSKPMFSLGNPSVSSMSNTAKPMPVLPTTTTTEKKSQPIIGIGGTTTPNFKFASNASAAAAAATKVPATSIATSTVLSEFGANTIKPTFVFGSSLSAATVGTTTTTTTTTTTPFAANASAIVTPQSSGSSSTASSFATFGNTFKPISDAATSVAVPTTAETSATFSFSVAANSAKKAETATAVTSSFKLPAAKETKGFSFGTTTATAAASHKSATQSSANSNLFSFGGGNNSTPSVPASTTTSTGGFSFARTTSAATNSTHTPATTTTNATNTGTFSFGGAAAASAPTSVGTGSDQASNIFGFAQKPANGTSTATPFAFNGGNLSNSITSTPVTKAAAAASANLFSFGGNGSSSEPAASASTTLNPSNSIFGGSATFPAVNGGTSSTFAFGGGQSTNSAFGGNGATVTAATTTTNGGNATNIAATPFAFEAGASQVASKTATGAGGGFSFAAVAAQNANATGNTGSIFGNTTHAAATTTAPAASNTSSMNQNFGFGGDSNNLTNSTTTGNSNSSFGGLAAVAATTNKAFSFNSSNNVAAGMSNPVAAGTPNNNSIFGNAGGGTKTTESGAGAGGFSFGKTSNSYTSNNATMSAFSFGGAASNAQGAQAKPFAFSGATAAGSSATLPAAPLNNVGGNIFATPTSGKPSGAAAPFSFGGATNNNVNASTTRQNNNNVFAPPATGPGDRIYRRATRRLQK